MTTQTRYEVTCDGADVAYTLGMENRREILKACKYDQRENVDWIATSYAAAQAAAGKAGWTAREVGPDSGVSDLCPPCTEALAGVE